MDSKQPLQQNIYCATGDRYCSQCDVSVQISRWDQHNDRFHRKDSVLQIPNGDPFRRRRTLKITPTVIQSYNITEARYPVVPSQKLDDWYEQLWSLIVWPTTGSVWWKVTKLLVVAMLVMMFVSFTIYGICKLLTFLLPKIIYWIGNLGAFVSVGIRDLGSVVSTLGQQFQSGYATHLTQHDRGEEVIRVIYPNPLIKEEIIKDVPHYNDPEPKPVPNLPPISLDDMKQQLQLLYTDFIQTVSTFHKSVFSTDLSCMYDDCKKVFKFEDILNKLPMREDYRPLLTAYRAHYEKAKRDVKELPKKPQWSDATADEALAFYKIYALPASQL